MGLNFALGDCAIGKGYQEEFVNCADIQIYKGDSTPEPVTATTPNEVSTTLAPGSKCGPWQDQYPYAVLDFSEQTVENNPTGLKNVEKFTGKLHFCFFKKYIFYYILFLVKLFFFFDFVF